MRGRFAWILLAAVSGSAPARVRAQSVAPTCAEDHVQGQKLLKGNRLLEARERFRACAVETCPASYRADCTTFLDELRARLPTIVLLATRGSESLLDVSVTVDGKPLVARLDGVALEIDPGAHEFAFTREGVSVKVTRIVVEGKKGQEVAAAFPEPTKPPPPATPSVPSAAPSAPPPKPVDPGPSSSHRTVGAIVAGVGAVVGITGVVIAGVGASRFNRANDECGELFVGDERCQPGGSLADDKASGKSMRTLGLVLLGGGALMAATGVVVYLAAPETGAARPAAALSIGPGSLFLTGSF